MKLRDYQDRISTEAAQKVRDLQIVYFAIEVRCGKTLISLATADKLKSKSVLFVTKKKAISSIESDYNAFNFSFKLEVVNFESLHKIQNKDYDLIIVDEAHSISAFPKPSKRAKDLKKIVGKKRLILMSGTPHPESYSQVFHQYFISEWSPFSNYKNFYLWAKSYVNVKMRNFGYAKVNDYSNALYSKIKPMIRPYTITFTQEEAGFQTSVNETVLTCKMSDYTYHLAKQLLADQVVEGKNEVILADTGVKMQSKIHQIYSGTVKFESGNSMVIDYSKVNFIADRFKGKKIAIFYKFKEELNALKEVYGDNLTTELDEFDNTDKNIALQFQSGKEGISLRNAECLVAYNIDFSSSTYWQFRDRMTTKDRQDNSLYWIFAERGIEKKIYNAVMNKKDYTLNLFKKDYGK